MFGKTAKADVDLGSRRFTRAEYYAFANATFDDDVRSELFDGEIDILSPANPPHARIVRLLVAELARASHGGDYLVDVQNPMDIDDRNAFEPDLACLRFREDEYASDRPTARDALLVIEVADTERRPQRKIARYLRDGTPQAWLVDVRRRQVEVHTSDGAEPVVLARPEDTLTFLDFRISLAKLFGT